MSKKQIPIANYIGTPFVQFNQSAQSEPKTIETMEAIIQASRNFGAQLAALGYDHSKYDSKRITVLAADRALVNTKGRRFKKDGTVLEETAFIYLVSKTGGSWKIYGQFNQDVPYFGSVF